MHALAAKVDTSRTTYRVLLVTVVVFVTHVHHLVGDETSLNEPPIAPSKRQHWAFRPLTSPTPPAVADVAWTRNAIDHFVLARLESAGLAPSPFADRVTLIRRLTFDLTGLPPTPEQVEHFLSDTRPDSYERLVDRLLASTAYGERWAQHWLDLARFAESDGFEHDHIRPNAYRYRDWVIDALNSDMPYDQFVRLQIAGDLLPPYDDGSAVATGFTLCGPDMPDINLVEERRHMVLNEMTATVGSVFLGLQIGCAECHDHKYDPISQADFYRLRAYFEPALQFKELKDARILREFADAQHAPTHLSIRGDFRRKGPVVHPAAPRIAIISDHDLQCERRATTSARVALANWLALPDNFLATRVIVNRLWQHHFGRGIVATPSDFGVMGRPPSHPDLLDWLATELPRGGWSVKRMHRLMVTSATYRQASRLPADTAARESQLLAWQRVGAVDPKNALLWRTNRKRLEGEAIRDAMLSAANRLNPKRGGRGVMPPLPKELVVTLLKNQWNVIDDEQEHRRRSIYLFVRRNLRYPLFDVFDRPDTNASCPRRARSTIAPQALVLLNSEFSLECAQAMATHILDQVDDDRAQQIELAYRRALGRRPSQDERRSAEELLAGVSGRSPTRVANGAASNSDSRADTARLSYLCLALFNLNEFIYID